jgi:hypothetical protein
MPTHLNVGHDDTIDSDVDPADAVTEPHETTIRISLDETGTDRVELDVDVGLVPEAPLPTEPTPTLTSTPTTTQPPSTSSAPTADPTTTQGSTTQVSATDTPATVAPPPTESSTTSAS